MVKCETVRRPGLCTPFVDTRKAPAPLDLGCCPRWDRHALDAWLDGLSPYAKKSARKTTLADLLGADDGGLKARVRQQLP